MKKEDLTGLFVYILMLGVGVLFGLTILKEYSGVSGLGSLYWLFIIGAILAGILVFSLALECGHIIGARVGRYDLVSVNYLGLLFYKLDNKFRFRLSSFNGLTGETKISPKDTEKKPNPLPFLLFPILFLLILIILFIVLFVVFNVLSNGDKTSPLARTGYFLLVMSVLGGMILIYDIFPARLDTDNDGYRFTLVANPKNKEAFNELLRLENAIANGEKDVEVKTFDEITNFTAELNLNKVYILLDNEKFEEAEPYIDQILDGKDGLSQKVYLRTKALKIFAQVMYKPLEEVEDYYNKDIPLDERKALSNDISMASVRAYLLMSGLFDKSEFETLRALDNVIKAYKRTNKNRQPTEMKLYNMALDKVIAAHPKWELEGYKLEDK